MAQPLLSYAQAAEEVRRFLIARAENADSSPPAERAAERVPLSASAGRVLATGIRADRDQPPFPRSTRDGFACRAAEASTHQFLFLAGRLRAGETSTGVLNTGEAWEIMTGAAVPAGADAVFMVEHVEIGPEADFVRLAEPRTLQPGENIVPQGAEALAGDLLIPPGVRLSAPQIALAAQCGYSFLEVAPRPRVAILSTGDELVAVETNPGPSQIRNSNAPMLAALVEAAGGIPLISPSIPDQESALDEAIRIALDADLLLITGGISAGRFDLVEDALVRAGAEFRFKGVAIQPGKPVVFGEIHRKGRASQPLFALPGNPISSAVTFQLFAAPVLAALAEDSSPQPRFGLARLSAEWRGKPGLTRFLPASLDYSQEATVRLVPWQGSGDLAAFARSNCFLVIPAETAHLAEGNLVQILLP